MEQIKDLVLTIARALVDDPDQVKVNVIEGGSSSVIELFVAKSDLGKVIGKQGRNANSIRIILNSVAGKTHRRVNLEIMDQRQPDAVQ